MLRLIRESFEKSLFVLLAIEADDECFKGQCVDPTRTR